MDNVFPNLAERIRRKAISMAVARASQIGKDRNADVILRFDDGREDIKLPLSSLPNKD